MKNKLWRFGADRFYRFSLSRRSQSRSVEITATRVNGRNRWWIWNRRDQRLSIDDATVEHLECSLALSECFEPALLDRIMKEVYRVLCPQGRAIIHIHHSQKCILCSDKIIDLVKFSQRWQINIASTTPLRLEVCKQPRRRVAFVDARFPRPERMGFRNAEFNCHFRYSQDTAAWCYRAPGYQTENIKFEFGRTESIWNEYLSYLTHYPENAGRLHAVDFDYPLDADLAYVILLNETWSVLEWLEQSKVPFVFVLYPGGGFEVDGKRSDNRIKRICDSPFFRGMITTQRFTDRYVRERELCNPRQVHYMPRGFVQFETTDLLPKTRLPDKENFEICFVAYKYVRLGKDKGFDIVIETAKEIHRRGIRDIHFNIVGNGWAEEIDTSEFADMVTFHGILDAPRLLRLYAHQELIMSPIRPFVRGRQFDGFPLVRDAMVCGVLALTTDQLENNDQYTSEKDIVIMPSDSTIEDYVEKILHLYRNRDELYEMSERCQRVTLQIPNDLQIRRRHELFNAVLAGQRA